MLDQRPWKRRTPEEANHFNPAFLGALQFEFVKIHSKKHIEGTPITLAPLALAIVLHKPTRAALPGRTITSLYEWLLENEKVLVGLSNRVANIRPVSNEALRFLFCQNCLTFSQGHRVVLGKKKAHFPASFIEETTSEVRDIVDRMKFVARWFAKSGSESSILASWRIGL